MSVLLALGAGGAAVALANAEEPAEQWYWIGRAHRAADLAWPKGA